MTDAVNSETKPHIVYCGTGMHDRPTTATCVIFPSYKEAFEYYRRVHDSLRRPHLIATVTIERVIDPGLVPTDPSE